MYEQPIKRRVQGEGWNLEWGEENKLPPQRLRPMRQRRRKGTASSFGQWSFTGPPIMRREPGCAKRSRSPCWPSSGGFFPSLGGTLERSPAAPQVSELRRARAGVSRHPGPFELSLRSTSRMSPLPGWAGGSPSPWVEALRRRAGRQLGDGTRKPKSTELTNMEGFREALANAIFLSCPRHAKPTAGVHFHPSALRVTQTRELK